ncbi:hypothetical protein B4144_4189 [Bacillus atrophaeus]|nr:hypothetical protein B4144_4189 [Bacillus atrophaeus]
MTVFKSSIFVVVKSIIVISFERMHHPVHVLDGLTGSGVL